MENSMDRGAMVSPWGRKESDTTEQHTHTQKSILIYLFEKLLSFNILTLCLSSFKFILHNPRYTYRYILFFINIKRKYLLIWKTTLSIILNENSRLQQKIFILVFYMNSRKILHVVLES